MTPTTLPHLDRANRLRWRAHLLGQRAEQVMGQPGQFARALRIHERSARAHLQANRALTLSAA
jgi:hypothetical protein